MPNPMIWIQQLPTIRVMAFHTVGDAAEAGAFQLLQEWFVQQQLPDGYLPRIFGYPKPLEGEEGFEVLIALPPDGTFTPEVSLRPLEACAYACVTSTRQEWDFVNEHIGKVPCHVRQGDQWVPSDAYRAVQRQRLVEYHADPEQLQAAINTGIVTPQYHHYTIMVPVAKQA